MLLADLHIHSTVSDGLLSPTEIVDWGIKKDLRAISITDHDNVSGIDTALEYGAAKGFEVIPGIELSTEYEGVEIHILGYFVDYNSTLLNSFLEKLKNSRIERAEKIISKLNRVGFNISLDEICQISKNASSIGRPHIARAMVKSGYSANMEDAFNKFLSHGRPAYVERYKISPFEAVDLLLRCKGVPSIAHPGLIINIDKYSFIKKLKNWGLAGIEVCHSKHSKEDEESFNSIAVELGLIPTGGTDCHGVMINNEPCIGSVTVSYESVIRLKEFTEKIK